MIICICNNLSEKELDKMTLTDYKELKNCGICESYVKEYLKRKSKSVQTNKT